MPIYEFYCSECNTIFSFFSKRVNTAAIPKCPGCGGAKMTRQVSNFAVTKGGEGPDEGDDPPVNEAALERAMTSLAGQAESMDDSDPRQAADLMKKFSKMTGMQFGDGMKEALARMEQGEDPEKIEEELGDLIESEDPFVAGEHQLDGSGGRRGRGPMRDPTLHEM